MINVHFRTEIDRGRSCLTSYQKSATDFRGTTGGSFEAFRVQEGAPNCVDGNISMIKGFESLRITTEDLLIGRKENLADTK